MDNPVDRAIQTLNSLQRGDLDLIRLRLGQVGRDLRDLGHEDLAAALEEARTALGRGDAPLFRRRVQHVVSRLGHLR